VITCGGITTDLLRNLLDEEDLQPKLLAARIPPCALATVDDPTVVMIASTAPLMSLSSTASTTVTASPRATRGMCGRPRAAVQ